MHNGPIARAAIAAGVIIASAALTTVAASPASADPTCPFVMKFSPATLSVEYGDFWSFDLGVDRNTWEAASQGRVAVSSTGTPSGYSPALYVGAGGGAYYVPGTELFGGVLYQDYRAAPLDPGTYTFTVAADSSWSSYSCDKLAGASSPPATLKVAAAPLGIETRVVADANNPAGAVVSAKFTGSFVDDYQPSSVDGAAQSPAGEWHLSIVDSEGTVAIERAIERTAGDNVLAASFYWADATPGEQYTATATFDPSGAWSSRYAVADSAEFAYTAPSETRPTPTSTAAQQPDAQLAEPTEFALPLWSYLIAAILFVAAAALTIVFAVRLRGRAPLAKEQPSTEGAAQ